MSIEKVIHIDNVRLSDKADSVIIIDQTQLPNKEIYIELRTAKDFLMQYMNLRSVVLLLSESVQAMVYSCWRKRLKLITKMNFLRSLVK